MASIVDFFRPFLYLPQPIRDILPGSLELLGLGPCIVRVQDWVLRRVLHRFAILLFSRTLERKVFCLLAPAWSYFRRTLRMGGSRPCRSDSGSRTLLACPLACDSYTQLVHLTEDDTPLLSYASSSLSSLSLDMDEFRSETLPLVSPLISTQTKRNVLWGLMLEHDVLNEEVSRIFGCSEG